MRKSCFLCMLLLLLMAVGGCAVNKNDHAETAGAVVNGSQELSQRQKEILEEQGLSADANELTAWQLRSITAIEDMLLYLEEKYDRSFDYVGYIPAGNLEKETLRACLSGVGPQTDSFDVTKTENGYEDNYLNIAIRDDYAAYVEEIMISSLNHDRLKVFADIYTTELTGVPDHRADYDGNVSSWKVIFIYLPGAEMESCCEVIRQVLETKRLEYDCDVIFLSEDVIDEITAYNYSDYLSSDYSIGRYTIKVE